MKKLRKMTTILLLISMMLTLVIQSLPVFAESNTDSLWDDKISKNLIPALREGISVEAQGWGKDCDTLDMPKTTGGFTGLSIKPRDSSGDLGTSDYTGGVYYTITLSEANMVRANKGDLSISASGKFWYQSQAYHHASVRVEFFSASGGVLSTARETHYRSGAFQGEENKIITLGKTQIPAGTSYMRIWFSNWGNLAGRPAVGEFKAYIYDSTDPAAVGTPYQYSVNGSTTLPEYAVPGDTVTYALDFDEAVTVTAAPVLNLSVGGNNVLPEITYSEDRQTVYFTTPLTNTGENTNVYLKRFYNLWVKDDAGNGCSVSYPSLSVGNLSYKSLFSVTYNLTNLSSSGNANAQYDNVYTAELTPALGYKLPSNITIKVNGSTISGYGYNSSTGYFSINASAIRGNVEITAAGVPQTYTVTLNKQGGSGGTDSVAATYTTRLTPITPPERAGYTFGGYYTAQNGGGEQYYNQNGNSERTYMVASNLTLYAKWTPKSYTVSLDAAGGTGSTTVTATYDADMPAIAKPTRTGYTFDGYFTQQNGGGVQYYNADCSSARKYDRTDGITLFAKWIPNMYTVTLDMQNGSGGTASVDATYDAAMPQITTPERVGYTFDGYYAAVGGVGAQYYYADGSSAKAFDVDSPCTLYAKWIANTYDVVLNARGGSGGATVTATYDSDMPVIVAPDKPGYLFGGYFTEANGGGVIYYNADCSSARTYDHAEGITLYAFWTPITYNIQLYSRGENAGTLTDVTYGELRLPSAETLGISYPNYNFMGWNIYDEQNWAMYTADRDYSVGLVTEQGKTAYIYAAWLEKDKYTITYDANGGEGAPAAVGVHVDETVTLSPITPIRENYTFIGWSKNADSDTAQYQPGDSFTMGDKLVTLFALWKKNPELTYNSNGGVFTTYVEARYPVAGTSVELTSAVPQKEGYTFVGWAESETAAAADIAASPYTMPNHDTVLYAVYEPIKYEVSVHTASGYSVSGINPGGYEYGQYAEFTVSGTNPKVFINGVRVQSEDGNYRFAVNDASSVVVSDSSSNYVIYSANGGTNAPIDMNTYLSNSVAAVKSELPVRNGYTCIGWASTPDADGAAYVGGSTVDVPAEDVILYAVWKPISYTVKYDSNGGNGVMPDTNAVYDTEFIIPENTYTKTGSQFAGWSYTADGEVAYASNSITKNLTETQNAEITL